MRLIVITTNLMQRLSGLPATPDITLLDLRKPKPHPWFHTNTTFRKLTYIRWCCIDLSNAPDLSGLSQDRPEIARHVSHTPASSKDILLSKWLSFEPTGELKE